MKSSLKFVMGIASGILVLASMPELAMAQEDVSQKQIPSLELEQADVREALRALFKNVNVSYSIAPEIQGSVTVSLKNVSFETALQHVLRQVDATYRVEGGIYEIVKRTDVFAPVSGDSEDVTPVKTTVIRRIKIRSADPQFIAMMIGRKGGNQNYIISPEQSTVNRGSQMGGMGMGGMGMGGMGMGGMGMGGMGMGGMGMGGMGMGGGIGGFGGGSFGGMGGGMGSFGGGGYGGIGGGMGGRGGIGGY